MGLRAKAEDSPVHAVFREEALEAHRRARGARVTPRFAGPRFLALLWGVALLLLGSVVALGLHIAGWLSKV